MNDELKTLIANSSQPSLGRGRPPLNTSLMQRAVDLVRKGVSISDAALATGIHRNTLGPYLRRLKGGELIVGQGKRSYGGSIMDVLLRAVPSSFPPDMREEVCQELFIELLNEEGNFANLRKRAAEIGKKFNRDYRNKWRMKSLETPINEDGGTLEDVLEG